MLDVYNVNEWCRQIGGLTLDTVYGIDMAPVNDPYIDSVEKALDGVTVAAVPGAFLVDVVPWLKYMPAWVPGAEFQRKAKLWKEYQRASTHDTYDACKKALVSRRLQL